MADTKISGLTEDTDPQPADLIATVDDPGGTPTTKKSTVQNVLKSVDDLAANATPVAADLILTIDDTGGTPTPSKTALDEIHSGMTAASTTVASVSELATATETTTGSDTGRTVTPDGLAGSDYGKRILAVVHSDGATAVVTGDGEIGIPITAELNGWDVVEVQANVRDKGVTDTTDVVVRRWRAGADADVLSTAITIGDEYFASDGVIDAANDDLITGDMLYVDVDAIHSGTAPNGLSVAITVQLP